MNPIKENMTSDAGLINGSTETDMGMMNGAKYKKTSSAEDAMETPTDALLEQQAVAVLNPGQDPHHEDEDDEHSQEREEGGVRRGNGYVDYAAIAFDNMQMTSSERSNLQLYHQNSITGGAFPIKLQTMLKTMETLGNQHIISWLPHGRAFIITRPRLFENEVMSKFFKQTKLSSFKRQLNLYDFKRIMRGVDSGSYYHEMFLRGKPILAMKMRRRTIKGHNKGGSNPSHNANSGADDGNANDPPKLYSMPFMAPLNHLDQTHIPHGDRRMESVLTSTPVSNQQERYMSIMNETGGHLNCFNGIDLPTSFSTIQTGVGRAMMSASSYDDHMLSQQLLRLREQAPLSMLAVPQNISHQDLYLHMRNQAQLQPSQYDTGGFVRQPAINNWQQQLQNNSLFQNAHQENLDMHHEGIPSLALYQQHKLNHVNLSSSIDKMQRALRMNEEFLTQQAAQLNFQSGYH